MGWFNSSKFYESGNAPKFNVGDILYLYEPWDWATKGFLLKRESKQCEIAGVSDTKNGGWFYKEFTYKVRFLESGKKYKNIYESQLSETKKGTQYSDPYEDIAVDDDEDK